MRIGILTAYEPIYHPEFFRRLLDRRAGNVAGIFLFPSRVKGRSRGALGEFLRFSRSFGLTNAVHVARQVAAA